jgi:lysozyme family protein
MTDSDIIAGIIEREGGFVNHPADRGGPTKFGITLSTLAAFRGFAVTANDVMAMSRAEAEEIYRERYIDRPGFSRIVSSRLRATLVDTAVLHGPDRAVRWLQEALRVKVDGVLGPKTAAAANAASDIALIKAVTAQRILHFHQIVTADPGQAVFIRGWVHRVLEVV